MEDLFARPHGVFREDDGFMEALLDLKTEKMPSTAVNDFKKILLDEPSENRWQALTPYSDVYELHRSEDFLAELSKPNDLLAKPEYLIDAYVDLACAKLIVAERKLWWGTVREILALTTMMIAACAIIYVCVIDSL